MTKPAHNSNLASVDNVREQTTCSSNPGIYSLKHGSGSTFWTMNIGKISITGVFSRKVNYWMNKCHRLEVLYVCFGE